MTPTNEQVLAALSQVQDPDLRRDIVSLKFVKDLEISSGDVRVTIELTTPACPVKEQLQAQCEEVIRALEGVTSVEVTMTAQVRGKPAQREDLLPMVSHIVAIASGKGGVGKSTVSLNLAVALAQTGARVGLMDADVYGPSIPLMVGAEGEHPFTKDQKIVPIEKFGIKIMSIGFLLEEGQSVLWRGPMVAGTVRQLLADVLWGELDYLLVDLPPGTGDAPMSLAQLAPLAGVAIVTTPQSVAASIAGKCAGLFRRLNTPVLGVIENMAEYSCENCGHRARLFSGTSGAELAETLKSPYLGSVPLDPRVGNAAVDGVPSLISHPASPQGAAFRDIAGRLAAQISIASATFGN
ncbi:MAG: Mrp/NBP35 family ATP-binding protein [Armatimonadetes bacterium]|nr:Mrp/NBP35 family ATP-binding protein [Armatimonadota bacterium]